MAFKVHMLKLAASRYIYIYITILLARFSTSAIRIPHCQLKRGREKEKVFLEGLSMLPHLELD